MAARLTPDQKVGSSNLSALILLHPWHESKFQSDNAFHEWTCRNVGSLKAVYFKEAALRISVLHITVCRIFSHHWSWPSQLVLESLTATLTSILISSHIHLHGMDFQCRDPGSNRGPSDLQSDALPTELSWLGDPRGLSGITKGMPRKGNQLSQ